LWWGKPLDIDQLTVIRDPVLIEATASRKDEEELEKTFQNTVFTERLSLRDDV
jgi:hypothetical protein